MFTFKYRFGICLATLLIALVAAPLAAQTRLRASELAYHVVGRNIVTSPTTAFGIGYLTFVEGIAEPFFSNPSSPGEATAFFTFRTDPYTFETFQNANIFARLRSAGIITKIYLNRAPRQDFNNPDSFSSGELVATFNSARSMATRVGSVAVELSSAKLTDSSDFDFRGKVYNFRRLVPRGVTYTLTGTADPIPNTTVFPFAGSAAAIGKRK